jgi:TIR domain
MQLDLRNGWTPENGPRAFPIDVFISHNRDDNSSQVAKVLSGAGLAVWIDENADLRDRRVTNAISTALRASRYVLVFVPSNFRDSEWCRAEYLPALRFSKLTSIARTIVVRETADINIPMDLEQAIQVTLDDMKHLPAILKAGNALSFDVERTLQWAAHKLQKPETKPHKLLRNTQKILQRIFWGKICSRNQVEDYGENGAIHKMAELQNPIAEALSLRFDELADEIKKGEFSQFLFGNPQSSRKCSYAGA